MLKYMRMIRQIEPKDKEYQIPFVPAPENMGSMKIPIPVLIVEKEKEDYGF